MRTSKFIFLLMCLAGAAPSLSNGAEWRFYNDDIFSRFIRELTGQEFYFAPSSWQIENVDGSLIVFKRRAGEIWIIDKELAVKRLKADRPGALLIDGLGRVIASMASREAGPLIIGDWALPLTGDVSISADQRKQYVMVSPSISEAEAAGRGCYLEVYALKTSERILRVDGHRASGIVSIEDMLLIFMRLPTKIDGMTRIPGAPRVILYERNGGVWKEKRRYVIEKPGLGSDLSYLGACPDGKSLLLAHISYPSTSYYTASFPDFVPQRMHNNRGKWLCLESDIIRAFLEQRSPSKD